MDVMSRLYSVLSALLLIGGVAALAFGAWPLGVVLVILGGAGLAVEIRARRRSVHIVLDGGADAGMQRAKATAVNNALMNQRATNQSIGGGGI